MAIYHLSVKPVSRSAGRSATAAAAYRAGCEITDERTGEVHDYRRKAGVESADIVLPAGVAAEWATDRAKLWNAAELAEKRKDACVAREYEVALPSELSPKERKALALDFAQRMADREGCAVDVCIHAPGKEGDNRNQHAHILRTTRQVLAEGMGGKLETEKAGRNRGADLEVIRREWAEITNLHLARAGLDARIDHRSLKDQGIDREPTQHLGPAATAIERRGEVSRKRLDWQAEANARLAAAKQDGLAARTLDASILRLDGDLSAALAERNSSPRAKLAQLSAQIAEFAAATVLEPQPPRPWSINAYERKATAKKADEEAARKLGVVPPSGYEDAKAEARRELSRILDREPKGLLDKLSGKRAEWLAERDAARKHCDQWDMTIASYAKKSEQRDARIDADEQSKFAKAQEDHEKGRQAFFAHRRTLSGLQHQKNALEAEIRASEPQPEPARRTVAQLVKDSPRSIADVPNRSVAEMFRHRETQPQQPRKERDRSDDYDGPSLSM